MYKFFSITILLSFVWLIKINGQEPFLYQLDEEKGLPSMEVYDVATDKNGIIWVGTDQGLFKYNGVSFIKYSNLKQSGKSILKIRLDSLNRIWCSNYNNQLFYLENDTLKLYEIKNTEAKQSALINWHIIRDKLYVFRAYHNLVEIDLNTLKQTVKENRPNIFDYWPTNNGAYLVEYKNNKVYFIDSTYTRNKIFELPEKSPNFLEKNGDSILLISRTETAITQYREDIGYIKHPLQKIINNKTSGVINILVENQNYWLLTYNGVFWISKNNGRYKLISHFLKDKKIGNAIKDKEGNYWFTSTGNGIFILPNPDVWVDKQNFDSPVNYTAKPAFINDSTIVYTRNNQYLVYLNTKTKTVTDEIRLPFSYDVETLKPYDHEHVLVSQFNVYLYNFKKKKVALNFPFRNTKDFTRLDNNSSLFNSALGVGLFSEDLKQQKLFNGFNPTLIYNNQTNVRYFNSKRSRCVAYVPKNNTFYIGYIEGLYFIKNQREGFIKKQTNPIQANSLSIDANNNIWVCTSNNGILLINDTIIVSTFSPKGFETDVSFNNGTLDNEGNFWFSCAGNIFGYNKKLEQIFHANIFDGLAGNQINGLAVGDEYIFATTNKGISIFDKKSDLKNKKVPDLFLKEIKVNGRTITQTNNLDYKSNNIIVSIYSNMYKARGRFKFLKRLLPDTNWTELPAAESNIYLTSLSPGKYTLQIMAVNEDNVRSKIQEIPINISKPVWQQAWFLVMTFVLFGLFITLVFKIQINRINREAALRQEKTQLEFDKLKLEDSLRSSILSALKAQMNPHFIFNALNSIQDYILTNEKKLATTFLGKFSDLIRSYLEMSNEDTVSLSKEIKTLKLYIELENLRFENSIEVNLNVDCAIDTDLVKIPALLIQPYVENAFKHGLFHKKGLKKLDITFAYLANNKRILKCTIADNGVGTTYTQELYKKRVSHKSYANAANKKRLEILNQRLKTQISVEILELKDEKSVPCGTEVNLFIPVVC